MSNAREPKHDNLMANANIAVPKTDMGCSVLFLFATIRSNNILNTLIHSHEKFHHRTNGTSGERYDGHWAWERHTYIYMRPVGEENVLHRVHLCWAFVPRKCLFELWPLPQHLNAWLSTVIFGAWRCSHSPPLAHCLFLSLWYIPGLVCGSRLTLIDEW